MRPSNKPRSILWRVPRVVTKTEQLMGASIMLAVIVLVARCITAFCSATSSR